MQKDMLATLPPGTIVHGTEEGDAHYMFELALPKHYAFLIKERLPYVVESNVLPNDHIIIKLRIKRCSGVSCHQLQKEISNISIIGCPQHYPNFITTMKDNMSGVSWIHY